jgi:hypothetical protein
MQRKAAAFARWHEPDDARVSSPDVCPVKAGMFSKGQTCRGRSQSSVVWIAEEMETEPSKPIDKISRGESTSHRAVSKENALWPRKKYPRGPSLPPKGEGSMSSRTLTDTAVHLGGVEATAR